MEINTYKIRSPNTYTSIKFDITETSSLTPILCNGEVLIQVNGTANNIVFNILRSPTNPSIEDNSLVYESNITGDPSVGFITDMYLEPGVAWWTIQVTSITGGFATLYFSGKGLDLSSINEE